MAKLFGTKKVMTQVFADNGDVVPVTVVDLNDVYLAFKSETKALIGVGKVKNAGKPMEVFYKELGYMPAKVMEVELDQVKDMNVGDKISASIFDGLVSVDVIGTSKGKGFGGVVKRHGFHGGPKTHGQSDRHRAPGSIGAGTTPGRVLKGKRMAGRLGGDQVTVKNLQVIKVDPVNNLLVLKGAIPGTKNSRIIIRFDK